MPHLVPILLPKCIEHMIPTFLAFHKEIDFTVMAADAAVTNDAICVILKLLTALLTPYAIPVVDPTPF